MIPQEIIKAKRDGRALAAKDISAFIDALTKGRLSEGQIAAFAMRCDLEDGVRRCVTDRFSGLHMLLAAFLTSAMSIAATGAWYLLLGTHRDEGRVMSDANEVAIE